ncbi:MAG: hypothetical protein PVG30_06985 [Gammaproteobacteria bacterium]|jgi:hypothetical protein
MPKEQKIKGLNKPTTMLDSNWNCNTSLVYDQNARPLHNISLDIINNSMAFVGDILNTITAPDNIRITLDNSKRKLARRNFKEKIIEAFLNEEDKEKIYQKNLSGIIKWFSEKCQKEKIALSIKDIQKWEERFLLLQHQARINDILLTNNNPKDLWIFDNKQKEVKIQTTFGVIKHAVFGISGITGIAAITAGAILVGCVLPPLIPLIFGTAAQTISGIWTSLWGTSNAIENNSKRKHALKKYKKIKQYCKDMEEIEKHAKKYKNEFLTTNDIKKYIQKFTKTLSKEKEEESFLLGSEKLRRIRNKKLRNSKQRYKTEKLRSASTGLVVGGAGFMAVGSIMFAVGSLLSSSVIGSPVGVPLTIIGGIICGLGATSFTGGYILQVYNRWQNNKAKKKYSKEDEKKDNSEIMEIIKNDKTLKDKKTELRETKQKNNARTSGLSTTGTIITAIAAPFCIFCPPIGIAGTLVGVSLLCGAVISGIVSAVKTNLIQKEITAQEYSLVKTLKGEIKEYKDMPCIESTPKAKLGFWEKIVTKIQKISESVDKFFEKAEKKITSFWTKIKSKLEFKKEKPEAKKVAPKKINLTSPSTKNMLTKFEKVPASDKKTTNTQKGEKPNTKNEEKPKKNEPNISQTKKPSTVTPKLT